MANRLRAIRLRAFGFGTAGVGTTLVVMVLATVSALQVAAVGSAGTAGAARPSPVSSALPTTRVLIPSNGATVRYGGWLDASAQSPVGIASVKFVVTGGSIVDKRINRPRFVITPDGWISAIDADDLPNGLYTLQSVVTDKHGNSAKSPGITINVQNVPINTEMGRPLDGATVSGVVPVDSAADGQTDITSVKYVLNSVNSVSVRSDRSEHSTHSDRDGGRGGERGEAVASGTLSLNGWIALWNTATVPNGSYTMHTVATERGGAVAMSQPIHITVQNNCADHGRGRGNDRDRGRGTRACEASGGGHGDGRGRLLDS